MPSAESRAMASGKQYRTPVGSFKSLASRRRVNGIRARMPTEGCRTGKVYTEEQTALPMYKFYRRLKLIDSDAGDKLAAISFADDSVLFGIQAADLVASVMRFEAHKKFFGTEYDYRKLHETITKQPSGDEQIHLVEYAFCDERMLRRTADGLRKIKRKPPAKALN